MLTIKPYGVANNITYRKQSDLFSKKLQSDVFVKNTNSISFKGKETTVAENDFIKWAKETNFIEAQLIDILRNPDNVIGSGFTHTAYAIPQNDKYVLRIETESLPYLDFTNIRNSTIEDREDRSLDINIGQVVANVSLKNAWNQSYAVLDILKKQTGETIGVQPAETLSKDGWGTERIDVESYYSISRKEQYARTIHKVAELPIEAYEKLICTFQRACDFGYIFDHKNSHNILVDSENKSLNLIDMNKGFRKSNKADFMKLLYSLTNINYYSTFQTDYKTQISDEKKATATDDTITIISKFLEAMQKQNKKFIPNDSSTEANRIMLSEPCRKYIQSPSKFDFWNKMQEKGLV